MEATILGIESSCDETAAAVVRNGSEIRSSVVYSQVEEHAVFGGVVPEVAARSHLSAIDEVIGRALSEAGTDLEGIDAIAVTNRPGLIGSLLVGLSAAKGLAFSRGLPLICIDHLEAHTYAAAMECDFDPYPCLSLCVSGGHTLLCRAETPLSFELLARTLDDAAGEAFDKVAHLLGLPYPGGPSVSRLASTGNRRAIAFPRFKSKGEPSFSFSGLKTAVLYHLRGQNALAPTPTPEEIEDRADIAASFQEALVDQLVDATIAAAAGQGLDTLLVVGGVACNERLRERMSAAGVDVGLAVFFPSPTLCTDNAAMIAGLGFEHLAAGEVDSISEDASPRSRIT